MNKLKLLTCCALIGFLSGCTAVKYQDYKTEATDTHNRIDQLTKESQYKQVRVLETPPFSAERILNTYRAPWLDEPISLSINQQPVSLVLDQILEGEVDADYSYDIDPNTRISLVYEGNKEGAIKMFALQSDFDIVVKNDRVYVQRYITETFTVNTIAGNRSYQIGSNSGGASSDNESSLSGEISNTAAGDGQYANLQARDYNITEQILDGVKAIIQDPDQEGIYIGSAEVIKAVSTLIVKTTPSLMKDVRIFVEKAMDQLGKEVVLEIEVIEFQSNEGSEFGINADIIKQISSGSLNISLGGTGLGDIASPAGIGFTGSGDFDGSTAVLKMLKVHGQVSVATSQMVKASNQQMQEIDLSDIRSYIAKTTTSYEGESSRPTVEVESDTVRDGVKMLVMPSVFDDYVYLSLNGVLSKFVYFDKQEVSGVSVSNPRTRQSRFNVSGKFSYNQPVVVTHMKQSVNQSNETLYGETLPTNSGEKTTLDTLVLLTPRRVGN